MSAQFDPSVIDNGLADMQAKASHLYMCSVEPTTYEEATVTFALGYKDYGGAGNALIGPTTAPEGQVLTSVPFLDESGVITRSGTPAYWAWVDVPNKRLLARGVFNVAHPLTVGFGFSCPAFRCIFSTLQ
jgi:hypothetical protein